MKYNEQETAEPEEKRQKIEIEESDSDDEIGPMKMFLQKQDKEEEKEETKEEELLPPPEKKARMRYLISFMTSIKGIFLFE